MTVNPDRLDIASSFRVWMRRFFTGHTHVTYGGLINVGIGAYLNILYQEATLRIVGILLVIVGIAITVDEASHLFTN